MADYIEREEYCISICRCNKKLCNRESCTFWQAPAADVAPVVHGRWENVQETDMYVPEMKFTITKTAETCSVCKARVGFVGAKQYLFDSICPNCGAKMDLEVSDGQT